MNNCQYCNHYYDQYRLRPVRPHYLPPEELEDFERRNIPLDMGRWPKYPADRRDKILNNLDHQMSRGSASFEVVS